MAARMVLQALMPGLKMLMATYRWSASPEDVATVRPVGRLVVDLESLGRSKTDRDR